MMKYFIGILLSFLFLSTHTYATSIYKQMVPENSPDFTVTLHAHDSLVVDYNFAEKKAIRCDVEHSSDAYTIHYIYKRHLKSAHLPVILESDHIPSPEKIEQLADISGQFTIKIDQQKDNLSDEISQITCRYLD